MRTLGIGKVPSCMKVGKHLFHRVNMKPPVTSSLCMYTKTYDKYLHEIVYT